MKRLIARIAVLAAAVTVTLAATAVPASATTWMDVWIQTNSGVARCVAAATTTSGEQMHVNACVDDAKQLWTLTPIAPSSPYYTIVNLGTGLCLSNGGTISGAPAVQLTCVAGATWDQWTLSGSGHTFILRNRGANLCLAAQSILTGAPAVLVTCNPGQQWQLLF